VIKLKMRDENAGAKRRGFTLVELLVVIAIMVVLATLVVGGVRTAMLKAQKVRALGTIREITTAMTAFSADYNRPPIPPEAMALNLPDLIFGQAGTGYTNDLVVAVLEGQDRSLSFAGGNWSTRSINPKLEQYMQFPRTNDKKNGVVNVVGDPLFGQIVDPWGRPYMVAINVPPFNAERSNGVNDRWMETYGLAVYPDYEPRYEPFLVWSYGRDALKGTAGKAAGLNRYQSSDDVGSW
jgi:prepilin-type N-terminal cleavage/methylation domain-containing protein